MMKFKSFLFALFIVLFVGCSNLKVEYDESSVTVATFNAEWLGDGIDDRNERTEYEYKMIADVIAGTGADIIGLQEVENEKALERIIKYLPNYKYIIGNTGWIQNPAVIFRDTVKVVKIEDYAPLAVKEGKTRAGLVLDVKKGNFDFRMMVVHFKSTSRFDSTEAMKNESYELRFKQANVIRKWADSTVSAQSEKDIIIVGDFNDNPKRKAQILKPLTTGAEYLFLTDGLPSCKNPNWDMIDHIVVNQSAFKRIKHGTVMVYDTYSKYEDYEVKKISDHCPVLVKFDITPVDND